MIPTEIERKYLVDPEKWSEFESTPGELYQQGYILASPEVVVRVRRTPRGSYLTIKGETNGAQRPEFEYPIPDEHADYLIVNLCKRKLTKFRHSPVYMGKTWHVDVFQGKLSGLIIAEIELASLDETFATPHWVAQEVTGNERYYNSNLAE